MRSGVINPGFNSKGSRTTTIILSKIAREICYVGLTLIWTVYTFTSSVKYFTVTALLEKIGLTSLMVLA